jgi:hypothetical protein
MLSRHSSFRPPAPVPYPNTPGPLDLVRTLWSNPIEAWTKAHFEEPIVRTSLPFGDVVVVNDPVAVRRVLQENETNYCKDRFQKRAAVCPCSFGAELPAGRRSSQRRLPPSDLIALSGQARLHRPSSGAGSARRRPICMALRQRRHWIAARIAFVLGRLLRSTCVDASHSLER